VGRKRTKAYSVIPDLSDANVSIERISKISRWLSACHAAFPASGALLCWSLKNCTGSERPFPAPTLRDPVRFSDSDDAIALIAVTFVRQIFCRAARSKTIWL
jgi:hypothetical protein